MPPVVYQQQRRRGGAAEPVTREAAIAAEEALRAEGMKFNFYCLACIYSGRISKQNQIL
jgi:hypothetical protein